MKCYCAHHAPRLHKTLNAVVLIELLVLVFMVALVVL
jgi:hypothetical protein